MVGEPLKNFVGVLTGTPGIQRRTIAVVTESIANVPRFLVVAPLGRDCELITGFLNGSGYQGQIVYNMRARPRRSIAPSFLGIILTDEALPRGGFEAVNRIVHAQPGMVGSAHCSAHECGLGTWLCGDGEPRADRRCAA